MTISKAANSKTEILVTSKLSSVDPDTKDPTRASLQSALAMPLRIVVSADSAIDPAFELAIARYTAARIPAIDSLAEIATTLTTATNAAKTKAAQKTSAPVPKSGPKPTVKAGAANVEDEEESDEGEQPDSSALATAESVAAPGEAGPKQASIFD